MKGGKTQFTYNLIKWNCQLVMYLLQYPVLLCVFNILHIQRLFFKHVYPKETYRKSDRIEIMCNTLFICSRTWITFNEGKFQNNAKYIHFTSQLSRLPYCVWKVFFPSLFFSSYFDTRDQQHHVDMAATILNATMLFLSLSRSLFPSRAFSSLCVDRSY